jgi:uridylate kinase
MKQLLLSFLLTLTLLLASPSQIERSTAQLTATPKVNVCGGAAPTRTTATMAALASTAARMA